MTTVPRSSRWTFEGEGYAEGGYAGVQWDDGDGGPWFPLATLLDLERDWNRQTRRMLVRGVAPEELEFIRVELDDDEGADVYMEDVRPTGLRRPFRWRNYGGVRYWDFEGWAWSEVA